MTDPLTRLAIQYGTDKFGYHDYTPVYFRLLNDRQEEPLRLMEIGVGGYADADRGGESLATWRDFFPNAEIVGVDIQKKTLDLGERVTVLQGSQVDADFMRETVREHGPFDVILDDGSHRNEHVVESFEILWSDLKPNGIYIIEDVQTAFFPRFGGSLEMDPPNSVGYFAELFQTLDLPDLAGMARFHNIIVLYKTSAPQLVPEQAGAQTVRAPAAALEEAVRDALASSAEDAIVCAVAEDDGAAPEIFKTCFVDVDHREKVVFFPEAESAAEASMILGLFRTPEGWRIEKGDNTYPSNFQFEPDHPRVVEAFEAMREILKDSRTEGGLTNFSDMLVRAGRTEEARPYVERLVEIGGGSRQFFRLAGSMMRKDENWGSASVLYQNAVTRFPDEAGFWAGHASVLSKLDRNEEAAESLEQAIVSVPRNANLRRLFGSTLARVGRLDEAIEQLRIGVDLDPKHAGQRRILGDLLVRRGDHGDALETFEASAELDPDFAATHLRIANCHRQLGQEAEAEEARKRAEVLSQM